VTPSGRIPLGKLYFSSMSYADGDSPIVFELDRRRERKMVKRKNGDLMCMAMPVLFFLEYGVRTGEEDESSFERTRKNRLVDWDHLFLFHYLYVPRDSLDFF
jgi:hypothetical protein